FVVCRARRARDVKGREPAAPWRPSVLGSRRPADARPDRREEGDPLPLWFEPPSEGGAATTRDRFCRKRGLGPAALAILFAYGVANGAAVASEETVSPRSAPSAKLLPADRMAAWTPGLMSAGGIPNRTTIYKTLSPSGGDDSGAIQTALSTAPAGQVVMLSPG